MSRRVSESHMLPSANRRPRLRQLLAAAAVVGGFVGFSWTASTQTPVPKTIPRDPSFNPQSAYLKERPHFPQIELAMPQSADGVVAHTNLIYRELRDTPYGDRALHLDVFHPAGNKGSRHSVVVLIHGGGWRSGSRSHLVPMAQRLAAAGHVAVPVEYRLALEAKYPASILDIKAAIRWLREHQDEYGIDPGKVAVLGCSSGAQLATLIGMTNDKPLYELPREGPAASTDVQAIINVDGVVSFIHPEAEAEIKGDAASTWLGARYEERPELWKEASPLEHAGPQSPPILFVNSSIPRFHAGRDDLIARLNRYGIYSEVHTLENTPHPFWLFHPWFEPTTDHVARFLDRVFEGTVRP